MSARFAFAALLLLVSMPAYADPPKLAIFDFELQDTSLEGEMRGPQADERHRLILISDLVRGRLTESGKSVFSDDAIFAYERHNVCYGADGGDFDE